MKALFIIAPKDFRDEELLEPKELLDESNVQTVIASKGVEAATGSLGAMVEVDIDYKDANPEDYDAIVFVGGSGSKIYFEDETAFNLARKAKVLAAICIAPSILANAGLLKGKKATAFKSEQHNLEQQGTEFTGEPVTVFENIVTASGPAAAREFGEAILKLLSSQG